MKPLLAALGMALLAGCGGTSTQDPAITGNTSSQLGDPAVYSRIENSSSCTYLQRQFDIAGDNTDKLQAEGRDAAVPLSYMRAAHTRMREVGCYG